MNIWIDRYCRLLDRSIALLPGLMVVLVFGNVVLRYLANSGITVSEELSRWLFVWMTFLGAIVALKEHAHAAMTATPKCLLGPIGAGIGQSLTPAMHEQEAAAHGLRLHYQLIELERPGAGPEQLPLLIQAARTMGYAGLNITYPCKQAVIPLLDELSDEARAMGAVNTVVFKPSGQAIGHNTDGSGWAWGFTRALPGADVSRVVPLGTGGAGSAIAHAVLRLGAGHLMLIDPEADRAQALADSLNLLYGAGRVSAGSDPAAVLPGATGLIHATPTGMAKLPGLPLAAGLLRPGLWVAEVVYFPMETALLKAARALGCAVSDGGGMAVGQAVGAFELFSGLQADEARMCQHFLAMMAQRSASADSAIWLGEDLLRRAVPLPNHMRLMKATAP